MALTEGQVQVGDLVMGTGTSYIVSQFNPYNRQVRANQTGDAPWGDGGWSGAEWREVAVVNMSIHIDASSNAQWQQLHWQLDAAFAPVRTGGDVELRWMNAGAEYLMYGRPRMLQPVIRNLRSGQVSSSASFVCPDPAIYSGTEYTAEIGLLHRIGGLSVPFGLPVGISSVVADGEVTLTNSGTADTRLLLHLTGPFPSARISLITGTSVQAMYLDTALGVDDFLDIDTKDKIVLLNGAVSRLADQHGAWPLLPPGTSTLRFESDVYDAAASLSARYRDTY